MCLQDGGIRRSESESRDVKICCMNKFIITFEVSVIRPTTKRTLDSWKHLC